MQLSRVSRVLSHVIIGVVVATVAALAAPARPAAAAAPTVVSLTFDDGTADQLMGAQILADHGMHGTFYVNSGRLGRAGRFSVDDVRALQAAGHEVGGHTITHPNLSTLSVDEQRRQICNDRVALLDLGLRITSFAYPFGANGPDTPGIVAECGYNSGRDVGGVVSPGACSGCPFQESIPPRDAYITRTPNSVKTTTSLADMQLQVTQAEANGGGWVQLVLHHVCEACDTPYAVAPATLSAFLDWLGARAATGTTVATVDEVIGSELKPGVAAPPPLPPSPTSSVLQNPSLETDANGDRVADCWQHGGFGTNTFAWQRTADAHTGAWAERVDVTSITSGDRKLVTRQDTGTCAPSGMVGRAYTVSAWYQSSVQPRLVVYYRTAGGEWRWWAQSAALAATSDWAQARWTTPPLPEGATAISVGMSIRSVGSLTLDDFTLDDAASP